MLCRLMAMDLLIFIATSQGRSCSSIWTFRKWAAAVIKQETHLMPTKKQSPASNESKPETKESHEL